MMVWLGHEPLGPQGGRYGYGKLARRLFNAHERTTRTSHNASLEASTGRHKLCQNTGDRFPLSKGIIIPPNEKGE